MPFTTNPANIELLVLDVDGVMTAGDVIIDEDGKLSYHFNVQDGAGIKYWRRSGGKVAIITGRESKVVALRAEMLDIDFVYQRALRKIEAYRDCLKQTGIAPDKVCCVGDDLPDIPLLVNCGFPVAVANAVKEVKACAAYITRNSGGSGAVREIVELLLRAQGKWESLISGYVNQTIGLTGDK